MKDTAYPRKDGLLAAIRRRSHPEQELMAKLAGTTLGQLKQIGFGNRPCNARTAIGVDKVTRGEVSMIELCPDLDWQYVRKVIAKRLEAHEPVSAS